MHFFISAPQVRYCGVVKEECYRQMHHNFLLCRWGKRQSLTRLRSRKKTPTKTEPTGSRVQANGRRIPEQYESPAKEVHGK